MIKTIHSNKQLTLDLYILDYKCYLINFYPYPTFENSFCFCMFFYLENIIGEKDQTKVDQLNFFCSFIWFSRLLLFLLMTYSTKSLT